MELARPGPMATMRKIVRGQCVHVNVAWRYSWPTFDSRALLLLLPDWRAAAVAALILLA